MKFPPVIPLLLAAVFAAPVFAEPPEVSDDGLQKVTLEGVDVAYVRPGVEVRGYQKVLLGPIEVAFRRGWERSAGTRPNRRVSDADQQAIRERLAAVIREEVVKELTAGGYALTDTPGADVLEVDLRIFDLYVVAPDQVNAPDDVYAYSAGEMTLVAELEDSSSGEILVRLFDKEQARETPNMHRIFHSENEVEARKMATEWAQTLRRLFDAARARAATP